MLGIVQSSCSVYLVQGSKHLYKLGALTIVPILQTMKLQRGGMNGLTQAHLVRVQHNEPRGISPLREEHLTTRLCLFTFLSLPP